MKTSSSHVSVLNDSLLKFTNITRTPSLAQSFWTRNWSANAANLVPAAVAVVVVISVYCVPTNLLFCPGIHVHCVFLL